MKRKNQLRKEANFKTYKSPEDFEDFLKRRIDYLMDLPPHQKSYDYFLGTVLKGFYFRTVLKSQDNKSQPKSRLLLSEYKDKYIHCRGIIGGIRRFKRYDPLTKKKTYQADKLLIINPCLNFEVCRTVNTQDNTITLSRKTPNMIFRMIDTHIWVDLKDCYPMDPNQTNFQLAIGLDIQFVAKVNEYRGKVTHDVRGKQIKYGLENVIITSAGYQTYKEIKHSKKNDADVLKSVLEYDSLGFEVTKDQFGDKEEVADKLVETKQFNLKEFCVVFWDRNRQQFVRNKSWAGKWYFEIENLPDETTQDDYNQIFERLSCDFLFKHDTVVRKLLKRFKEILSEELLAHFLID